jgi:hypothetical protein
MPSTRRTQRHRLTTVPTKRKNTRTSRKILNRKNKISKFFQKNSRKTKTKQKIIDKIATNDTWYSWFMKNPIVYSALSITALLSAMQLASGTGPEKASTSIYSVLCKTKKRNTNRSSFGPTTGNTNRLEAIHKGVLDSATQNKKERNNSNGQRSDHTTNLFDEIKTGVSLNRATQNKKERNNSNGQRSDHTHLFDEIKTGVSLNRATQNEKKTYTSLHQEITDGKNKLKKTSHHHATPAQGALIDTVNRKRDLKTIMYKLHDNSDIKYTPADNTKITDIINKCKNMENEVREDFRKFSEYKQLIESLEETIDNAYTRRT